MLDDRCEGFLYSEYLVYRRQDEVSKQNSEI